MKNSSWGGGYKRRLEGLKAAKIKTQGSLKGSPIHPGEGEVSAVKQKRRDLGKEHAKAPGPGLKIAGKTEAIVGKNGGQKRKKKSRKGDGPKEKGKKGGEKP